MKFVVDTSQVVKGIRDYKAAVDGIFTSLDKFEAHVKKTMDGVARAAGNRTNLTKFKKSLEAFGDVKIDASAARKLSALSQALNGFKTPSMAQSRNTTAFFRAMSTLPDMGSAYRSIRAVNDLKTAMNSFSAPSAAQTKRLREFAAALKTVAPALTAFSKVSGISGIANELASISIALRNLKTPSAGQVTNLGNLALALRSFNFANLGGASQMYAALNAISGFRAPSAAQIRNLQTFVNAVATMQVPPNADRIAAALTRIANASSNASTSMGRFRASLGPVGGQLNAVGNQAHRASIQMMGLQNAFSGTFQIGSVLRSLLGSLTVAELGRNFFEAANQAETFKAQMSVISEDAGFAASQLNFVSNAALKMGIDVLSAQKGFGKLSIAADKAGMSVGDTREVFTGFGMAMTVLGTSVDRQNDVFLAMQQVMSKGYLSAEELNQQLNEHLPVARGYATEFAASLGMSLDEALKKKAIDASEILTFMAQRMQEDFGPAMEKALNRPSTQMTILRGQIDLLFQKMGESGAVEGVTNLLKEFTGSLTPEAIERYGKAMGEKLFDAFERVREVVVWFRENWDSIQGPLVTGLKLLGQWMVVSGAFQIGRFLVSPLFALTGVIGPLLPLMWDLVRASRALAATNLAGYYTQLAQISNPAIANGVTNLSTQLGNLSNSRTGRGLLAVGNGISNIGTRAASVGPIIARLGAVIGTGLAVAWGVGAQAAEDSLGRQVTVSYSATEILAGMWFRFSDWVTQLWDDLTTGIVDFVSWAVKQMGLDFSKLPEFVAKVAFSLSWLISKAMEAIVRTVAAGVMAAGKTLMDLGGALGAALTGDFDTAAAKAWGAMTGASAMEGFKSAFTGFDVSAEAMRRDYAATGRGFAFLADGLNTLGAEGRARLEKPRRRPNANFQTLSDAEYEKLQRDLGLAPPESSSGGGGSGGRRGRQGRDPAEELLQNAEQLASLLERNSPVEALNRQFAQSLAEQGRLLLSDSGFKAFFSELSTQIKGGQVDVNTLISTLQKGGAESQAMLAALRDNYGWTVTDIVGMLVNQQAAFNNEVNDAIDQALDLKYAHVKNFIDAFGEAVPRIGELGGAIEQLGPIARNALSPDIYEQFMDEMRSGTIDAADGVEVLKERVREAALTNVVFAASLRETGVDVNDLIDQIDRIGGALRRARREQEDANQFGRTLLNQMDEEVALLSVREDQRDMVKSIADAVKNYDGEVTPSMLANLEQEIRKRKELAGVLQRENEFRQNNGIRSYLNDIQQAGAAAQELDRNVLQSLEDQLFSLGTTGEFSFNQIFDTIQQGLVRFASQQIMKTVTESLFSAGDIESGNPTIFGKLLGSMGFDYKAADAPRGQSEMTPLYVWTVNGDQIGINPETGQIQMGRGNSVTVGGMTGTNGPMTIGTAVGPAGSTTPMGSATTQPIEAVAQTTAQSFGDSMVSLMPMIGMAFSASFKSPIAQIAGMFVSMILPKLMGAAGGGGGGGGIFGSLLGLGMSFLGGGGPSASLMGSVTNTIAANPGLFKEGGYPGSPVARASVSPSMFANAPHYAEGTPNTSGGIPAILHDNEAVIPLSRNRKVPVEMAGGNKGQVINNNFTINTPDADSFRKSRTQLATQMHMQAGRAYRRNHG